MFLFGPIGPPELLLILLIVIYSSLLAGIFFPKAGEIFQSFPLYCMMALLFLSFLSISLSDISQNIRSKGVVIGVFLFIRMILLPAAIFFSCFLVSATTAFLAIDTFL